MEPSKFMAAIQGHSAEPTLTELIERSTLLTVVEHYIDHNVFIDRAELAALIGHKLPAEISEVPHDPLP